MREETPVIEIKGIKKGFYGVPVLKGIDLKFYKGECVSLIGENGAGKSTLIKILCGVYSKDAGQIFLNGVEQNISNAEDAKKLGISVIYQELSLFPDLKVYENIFSNNEITKSKGGASPLEIAKMKKEAASVLHDRLHVDIDINARVADIPFSQKQMVEIARAVHANSQIIFMDEPTTALEDKEKKTLFKIIADLKAQDKTIIFISHHLDEIFANCEPRSFVHVDFRCRSGRLLSFSTKPVRLPCFAAAHLSASNRNASCKAAALTNRFCWKVDGRLFIMWKM